MIRRFFILGAGALPLLPRQGRAQGGDRGPDLSRYAPGNLPAEFVTDLRTGQGPPGAWRIVEDRTAAGGKAIEQASADPTDYRFPLAVYEPVVLRDVEASIRFKAVSGRGDRAGGIAVRLRGPGDYYVARANALEDNVNLYRVVRGRRQEIAGANARVPSGEWLTLTLLAQGDRLSVALNGRQLIAATDKVFGEPGRIALWTKADSVTRFDRLEIRAPA